MGNSNLQRNLDKPETIQKETINRLFEELSEIKSLKKDILEIKNGRVGEKMTPLAPKVQVFSDSFFKYVEEDRCFGYRTKTHVNRCYTLDDVINTLEEKRKDETVTQVVIQSGFNDLKNHKKASTVVDDMQQCIQLTRVLYPNATIPVGEILPHPNNENMNNGVSNVNYFLKEEYLNLKGKVRFVEHPICRVDNELL